VGRWGLFPLLCLEIGTLPFVLTRAGYGNGPGWFWGNPISFSDPTGATPKIFGGVLMALLIAVDWFGIRSGN
jgi:hypothetical protein